MSAPCPRCGSADLVITIVWTGHLRQRPMAVPVSTCLRCDLAVVGDPDDTPHSPHVTRNVMTIIVPGVS